MTASTEFVAWCHQWGTLPFQSIGVYSKIQILGQPSATLPELRLLSELCKLPAINWWTITRHCHTGITEKQQKQQQDKNENSWIHPYWEQWSSYIYTQNSNAFLKSREFNCLRLTSLTGVQLRISCVWEANIQTSSLRALITVNALMLPLCEGKQQLADSDFTNSAWLTTLNKATDCYHWSNTTTRWGTTVSLNAWFSSTFTVQTTLFRPGLLWGICTSMFGTKCSHGHNTHGVFVYE